MIEIVLKILAGAPGFARAWWKVGLGVTLGVILALPLGRCQGVQAERHRQAEAARAAAQLQAHKNASAAQAAAAERALDAAHVATDERTRTDAIDAAPAGRAQPSSVALACQRLRQQGARPETLPAACGPQRPGQAAAHH